ncbi:MAG: hypothetical protein ACYSWP_08875, partial [Planctomycetota bacterium]
CESSFFFTKNTFAQPADDKVSTDLKRDLLQFNSSLVASKNFRNSFFTELLALLFRLESSLRGFGIKMT